MTATYVYGVRSAEAAPPRSPDDAEEDSSTTGINGAPLREVVHHGLAALVSDIDAAELKLGRNAMTAHARVLEHAIASSTVLPMRFGVVMEDEPAVRTRLLDAHEDELRRQLEQLEGKVELKLRATYDEATLMREVVRANPDIDRLRATLKGKPEDATYFERIRLGEMIAASIEHAREADSHDILQTLAPLALDVRVGAPAHERVALSASFLVERSRMPEFDAAVDEVGKRHAHRLRLTYTGPLPPHSFVELAGAGSV